MKKQAFNPYLPSWETVPDGEPHVFDGRVYIFGSHDGLPGTSFCEENYVGWSAPVDDLSDWRFEGVIYDKNQDPINGAPYDKKMPEYEPSFFGAEKRFLYAPDVAKGPDGRYYLYYALDTVNVISVAVCDTPAGKYEFLDYVTREDGSIPQVGRWFDPAILCEEGGNYLYYGFCPPVRFPGMEELDIPGSMMVRLADDMHTIISEPVCVANGVDTAKGTGYEAHPFFEGSSIRHFGDWYYFIYSSLQGHELCLGAAKTPEGPFEFKGVVVSNGDIGYKGNTLAVTYTGNNHGGLVQIKDKYYIFWHRHSHGIAFARQGCADEVILGEDGMIEQIEITSCGLNGGPLEAKGKYSTYIACHLTEADRTKVGEVVMAGPGESVPKLPENMPYITEEKKEGLNTGYDIGECDRKDWYPYIANMCKGTVAGFKYFAFDGSEKKAVLTLRGQGSVSVILDTPDGQAVGQCTVSAEDWTEEGIELPVIEGVHALYFKTEEGAVDFAAFEIQ